MVPHLNISITVLFVFLYLPESYSRFKLSGIFCTIASERQVENRNEDSDILRF